MSERNRLWAAFVAWIKNTKYLPQLPVYEVARCETRYEEMAARGWLLKKRGLYLDRYGRGAAEDRQYRLEFCKTRALDGILELPDEQVEFYAECGWTKVCYGGGTYVFSAPKGSRAEELYTDPQEQITMLRSVRTYACRGSFALACVFLIQLIAGFLIGKPLLSWVGLYSASWLLITLFIGIVYYIWKQCYGSFRSRGLIRRLKKGRPLRDPEGQPRHLAGRAASAALCVLLGIFLIGTAVSLITMRKSDLPEVGSQVPYLLGEEFLDGKRSDRLPIIGQFSDEVEVIYGLLSDYYSTREYLTLNGGGDAIIYQDYFLLRGGGRHAFTLARSLAKGNPRYKHDHIHERTYGGFDYVLTVANSIIAVQGQHVIRITCYISGNDTIHGTDAALRALDSKWNEK